MKFAIISLQADVFSFGCILYEVLRRNLTICAIAVQGTRQELEAYAKRVGDTKTAALVKLFSLIPAYANAYAIHSLLLWFLSVHVE